MSREASWQVDWCSCEQQRCVARLKQTRDHRCRLQLAWTGTLMTFRAGVGGCSAFFMVERRMMKLFHAVVERHEVAFATSLGGDIFQPLIHVRTSACVRSCVHIMHVCMCALRVRQTCCLRKKNCVLMNGCIAFSVVCAFFSDNCLYVCMIIKVASAICRHETS